MQDTIKTRKPNTTPSKRKPKRVFYVEGSISLHMLRILQDNYIVIMRGGK
jgi:hypothetical protein